MWEKIKGFRKVLHGECHYLFPKTAFFAKIVTAKEQNLVICRPSEMEEGIFPAGGEYSVG